MKTAVLALLTIGLLAGCGKDFGPSSDAVRGPDEFGVVPTAPLQKPSSYTSLPVPLPGTRSLADPTPKADAIATLGGTGRARSAGTSDAALLRATGGGGAGEQIRADLLAEGSSHQPARRGWLAFGSQRLDAQSELQRLRAMGVATPSAPPK